MTRKTQGGSSIPVHIASLESEVFEQDEITDSLVTIDIVHHETHEGEMFIASYKNADGAPVADNGTMDLQIYTGAKYCHTVFSATFGGDFEVAFYENPTTSGGTSVAANNMNRNKGIVATAAVVHTPSVSNVGTLLFNIFEPGGQKVQAVGGATRSNSEWILLPERKYLLRATNRAGSTKDGSVVIQWYEEDTV